MKAKTKLFIVFVFAMSILCLLFYMANLFVAQGADFDVVFDSAGIASLKLPGDATGLDFIKKESAPKEILF